MRTAPAPIGVNEARRHTSCHARSSSVSPAPPAAPPAASPRRPNGRRLWDAASDSQRRSRSLQPESASEGAAGRAHERRDLPNRSGGVERLRHASGPRASRSARSCAEPRSRLSIRRPARLTIESRPPSTGRPLGQPGSPQERSFGIRRSTGTRSEPSILINRWISSRPRQPTWARRHGGTRARSSSRRPAANAPANQKSTSSVARGVA